MPQLAPQLNQRENRTPVNGRHRRPAPPPQPAPRKFGTTLTLSAANSKAQSASL